MSLYKNQATREILLNELIKGICKIVFIKKDGSTRVAFCTLNSILIPSSFEDSITKIFLQDANPEIIPFWDVAQGKWKSFYVDKVELFITAEELKKQTPEVLQSQKDDADKNIDGNELQDMDENTQDRIEQNLKKSNSRIDKSEKEKTVNPINRQNIRKKGHRINTKSNITNEHERKRKNLEEARHIINTLRAQAEANKFRRKT
jgi:hypothetical protein